MSREQHTVQAQRFRATTVIFMVILLGIVGRLYYLQVVRGSYYAGVAEDNRLRIISTDAPRGEIRDRNGVVLATDVPSFDIVVTTYDLEDEAAELGEVARLTGNPVASLTDTVAKAGVGPFSPITVVRNVSKSVALKLAEMEPSLPGIQLVMSTRRFYPQGSLAAHLLGYTGEISDNELTSLRSRGYAMKDTIGKDGIELQYESLLRGTKSQKLIEVDVDGKVVKVLQEKAAVPGKSLVLSIDIRLQKTCEELLGQNPGAAVMQDPRTGEILALASSPTFDPNKFVQGISEAEWTEWSARQTLFNRAVLATFPPGSTFKVVTAAAALETGKVTDRTVIRCTGSLTVGGNLFKCWIWPGAHGNEDIYRGFADSCDAYFYTVAQMVGVETMDQYAHRYGVDQLTGIDLPGEVAGSFATPDWKLQRIGEPWYVGDTMNMGIGQGYLLLSPLRVASMYSAIAMNGALWRPRLLHSSIDPVTNSPVVSEPVLQGTLDTSLETLATIKKGLHAVTLTGGMTQIRIDNIDICAKTGTAETDVRGEDHTWLVAFAPMESPRVTALLMYEHSPYARSTSMAPLMQRMLQQYFELYGGSNGVD
jgi:penicillin-binding protein 2